MMVNGPTFTEPAIGEIPENIRSETCQATKERLGSSDAAEADLSLFKPERWLRTENGEEVFDATLGPMLTFGLGPRGCFGKRMAYLELRIVIVLLFWNFEFQSTPESLSSYRGVDNLTHSPAQCYVRLLHSPLQDGK